MTESDRTVITVHGWGFSPDIWAGWEQMMPSSRFLHADRGYFDTSRIPSFPDDGTHRLLIVHSFGLHWCPPGLVEAADSLVILSGFLHFHPESGPELRRSRLTLHQMMSRFVEKPDEVLERFYTRVYTPDPVAAAPGQAIDHERLLEDLERLNSSRLESGQFSPPDSITIIHGTSDRIVSRQRARELYAALLPDARYFEIKGGGHAVGFTHAETCIRFLNPIVSNQENQ